MPYRHRNSMAAFKRSSQNLNLGSTLDLVDGTPANLEVTLPLSSLDREVFVVTDIQMEYEPIPTPTAAGNTVTLAASVNKTGTAFQSINDPDTIGSLQVQMQIPAIGTEAVLQSSRSPDEMSSGTVSDYIGIIATPNYVLAGTYATTAGGALNRAVSIRLTGYRAVADASTYAALVTEELNS